MAYIQTGQSAPAPELARLVELHGPPTIFIALLRVLARRRHDRRRTLRATADLSPHLRRDIGLPDPDPGKVQVPGLWI